MMIRYNVENMPEWMMSENHLFDRILFSGTTIMYKVYAMNGEAVCIDVFSKTGVEFQELGDPENTFYPTMEAFQDNINAESFAIMFGADEEEVFDEALLYFREIDI